MEILKNIPDITFVSLQYGDCHKQIENWNKAGIPIIYDKRINSLKNMDHWIDQVAACDAVVSVANTTIHGAGGLNIPTLCLLSIHSDWRWFKDDSITNSYWYPSVEVAWQSTSQSWTPAITKARQWLTS